MINCTNKVKVTEKKINLKRVKNYKVETWCKKLG